MFIRLDVCELTGPSSCTAGGEGWWQTLDTVDVTIADPRPPTAQLTLNGPSYIPPLSTFELNGATTSLLGAAVADAEVVVSWTVQSKSTHTQGYSSSSIPAFDVARGVRTTVSSSESDSESSTGGILQQLLFE